MAEIEITRSLFDEIQKKFKGEAHKIFDVKILDENFIAKIMELNLEHPNLKNLENYILDGTQDLKMFCILMAVKN